MMAAVKRYVQIVLLGLVGVVGSVAVAWAACSDLCKQMTIMNYEVKMFIDPGLPHPELNAQTLTHIATMKGAAIAAHDLIPEKAAGNPLMIAEYQKAIDLLVSSISKMSAALAINDNPSAQRIMNDIKSLKLEGHTKFKNDTNH